MWRREHQRLQDQGDAGAKCALQQPEQQGTVQQLLEHRGDQDQCGHAPQRARRHAQFHQLVGTDCEQHSDRQASHQRTATGGHQQASWLQAKFVGTAAFNPMHVCRIAGQRPEEDADAPDQAEGGRIRMEQGVDQRYQAVAHQQHRAQDRRGADQQ